VSTPANTALIAASPRLSPRPVRLAGIAIHLGVTVLWIVLFARALSLSGVLAWSAGIVYVAYDTFLLLFVAWQTRGLTRPTLPNIAGARRPSLGVLIASHNEAAVLPVTLAALFAQTEPADEIVITDDGSTDATESVLTERYGITAPSVGAMSLHSTLHPNLRWLRLKHGGKAVALNEAITQIDTETILTVDADTLLDPTALQAMRDAFAAEPALVAATGILTPICSKTLGGRFFQWFQTYEYIRNFISRYAWMRIDGLLLISGAFAGFRREAVTRVGGFDPECFVEDYELIHRLHRYSVEHGLDWTVRVLGTAHALTDAPSTLPAFLRQRRRWFAGFLQTQYWNRDMTGNGRFGRLGTIMLPIKAIDTMQPIYGLTAFALLLIFIFSGRFSVALPVLSIIAAKIAIDLAFHLWSIRLYRRWTGDHANSSVLYAIIAALAEPFSFQLMRHTGASLGWVSFLTGKHRWGTQRRDGLLPADAPGR
jgi:cellulose synthase/poly-beta-1,6-N-acetylglucosamine synthase-like glycosyltransferase